MDSKTLSQNFSVAKVLAIFMVVTSHWFTHLPLWIPSAVALFIFGFASTFFTSRLHGTIIDVGAFWKNKIQRLGIRYWFILGVLSVLLILQGKEVFHWHSLVHFMGMSGILNLFGASESGLGRGLWFFTLLLLFYVLYPYTAKRLIASRETPFLLAIVVAALLLVNQEVRLGFSLWLTMIGFILGMYIGVNRFRLSRALLLALVLLSACAFGMLNAFFAYRELNGLLLFVLSTALALWLTVAECPRFQFIGSLARLEKYLLEIYLIHSYFFIRPTGNPIVDFVLSLGLILAVAMILNTAGNKIVGWMFQAKPLRAAP
ncbi:acyltransferase family protein [Massilia niastensis]|uniref:acyltransferase family protein n=1 Tax=Massilia niastensis TaxID=544911 RepID=UPI00038011FC|nr:acyltransferase family protein [Massilia niastensis]